MMAGYRRNPILAMVTNPGEHALGSGDEAGGERTAWANVSMLARRLMSGTKREEAIDIGRKLLGIAHRMVEQLETVGHRNPPRRNPGLRERGTKFGQHVQAVVYDHVSEGPRVHGFGNADPVLRTSGDKLSMTGLHERTDVEMFALSNGDVLLKHRNGKPLWREDD